MTITTVLHYAMHAPSLKYLPGISSSLTSTTRCGNSESFHVGVKYSSCTFNSFNISVILPFLLRISSIIKARRRSIVCCKRERKNKRNNKNIQKKSAFNFSVTFLKRKNIFVDSLQTTLLSASLYLPNFSSFVAKQLSNFLLKDIFISRISCSNNKICILFCALVRKAKGRYNKSSNSSSLVTASSPPSVFSCCVSLSSDFLLSSFDAFNAVN